MRTTAAAARAGDAAADFERATRGASVLRGSEPLAVELSVRARATRRRAASATRARSSRRSPRKGNPMKSYLRQAVREARRAAVRRRTRRIAAAASPAARQQAVGDLTRLEAEATGAFAETLKQLVAGCNEAIGYDAWRAGQTAAAGKALAAADKGATGDLARRVQLDRAATALGKDKIPALEGLAGNPPEALVDLGIVYDLVGRPKDAYDAWVRARARGVKAPDLQKWIDAKKRIYGFTDETKLVACSGVARSARSARAPHAHRAAEADGRRVRAVGRRPAPRSSASRTRRASRRRSNRRPA